MLKPRHEELDKTRDYVQDVAKSVGKIQQCFLPVNPDDWHKGFEIVEGGLITPKLNEAGQQISIDLLRGEVSNGQTSWKLGQFSAQEIFNELRIWAKNTGAKKDPPLPDFAQGKKEDYNSVQSHWLADMLGWGSSQLKQVEKVLLTGVTSPILLYPHHFDLSLVWFLLRDNADDLQEKSQVGLGFSFGDEYINEPYFYGTAWPEPTGFTKNQLSQPAYWNKDGFSGGVLKYGDLVALKEPEQNVLNFLESIAAAAKDGFGA